MNEYLDKADEWTEDEQIRSKSGKSSSKQKKDLETEGPDRDKANILHKDGSFAELPGKEGKGSGALDGMVGRGT
jgi:hypothetical protein